MKRFIYSILYCVAFLAIASCSELIAPEANTVNPGDITLSIFSATPGTRAVVGDIAGVPALNENKIQTVHYFFYPKNVGADNTSVQPALVGKKEGLSSETEYSWTINVTDDKLKKVLFPMPYNSCDVYVIVNLPESESKKMEEDTNYDMSLPNLRRIALEANFNTTDPQTSFVMEGLGVANIIDRKAILAAEGNIEVDRVAAKISVDVKVKEQLTPIDGETSTNGMIWESMPQDMTIELVNGVKTAVLEATPTPVTEGNKFFTTPRGVTVAEGLWSCVPFYSYPANWEVGAETEPYLRITLPWKTVIYTNVNGEQQPVDRIETCLYKVILGGETLNRNTWYDLDINIGILGSFENEEEVVIPLEDTHYFVADWSTGTEANAAIEGARYLIVEENLFNVYNQDEVRIPFTSSHICEIVDMSVTPLKNRATVTYPDYSETVPKENEPVTWNSNNWYIGIENGSIVMKHALRNDISAGTGNFDYAPYTIKFMIRHSDLDENGKSHGEVYYQPITIIQYPAMIIQCMPNRKLGGNGYGGAWVNGGRSEYGGLREISAGGGAGTFTTNPNMYVIQTSVLPSDSDLIIGDPRSLTPNNLNNNNWETAPDIDDLNGEERTLQYYYPTLTTAESKNIIAPKFRISSSYSVCPNTITHMNAQYRCASYQEDGYPAGRWRLPTAGEVQYMILLSTYQVIPSLFTASMNYWCSTGTISGQGVASDDTSGRNVTRCVYDEWYWENSEHPRLEGENIAFTWGDAER